MTNSNNNYDDRNLDLPQDTGLPFFAYGIFKPGQLAHSKIKNHVIQATEAQVNHEMRHRDGVPILIYRESDYSHANGVILTFRQGQEETAYDIICKTLLKALYEWKTIMIDGTEVNILFGVEPDNGSDYIEDPHQRINFDGKDDPLFSEAIELIEKNLMLKKDHWKMESFFELQMNYMLLWSAIDRFSSIKFNKSSSINNQKFARQKAFRQSIRKFKDEHHRPVYSTDDLKVHRFDADDSLETLKYYYTFRCNVVHRGKAMISDYGMLEQATRELLEIFKDVLASTFG